VSDDDPLASLLADISSEVDADLASISEIGDEAGGGTPAEAVEWEAPLVLEVDLPMDVSLALDDLVSSVQGFLDAARPFLESDHLDVEGIAQQMRPVGSADDYPGAEEQLAAWQATIDGRTRGLTELMALVDENRRLVRDYSARMAEVFAGAPPPPQPPPPPPPPEDEGPPPDDQPAASPV
jgi:hypothetical protein